MQFFGISKTSFNCFFPSGVYFLPSISKTVLIDLFFIIFPNMPCYHFFHALRPGTTLKKRASAAFFRFRMILAVPIARCCLIGKFLTAGTEINIFFPQVLKLPLIHIAFLVIWFSIADNTKDVSLVYSFAYCWCEIASIQSNTFDTKSKFSLLIIQPLQIRQTIVDIRSSNMGICYDIGLSVHCPVIKVEKSLWLAIPHHVAAIRIRRADFPIFLYSFFLLCSSFFPDSLRSSATALSNSSR
jgi:hypothetical protein